MGFRLVKRKRRVCAPSLGFLHQLSEYESYLGRPTSMSEMELDDASSDHPGERMLTGVDDEKLRQRANKALPFETPPFSPAAAEPAESNGDLPAKNADQADID